MVEFQSTGKRDESIPSEGTPTFIWQEATRLHETWVANISEMAAAYCQKVGIPPHQACLVQKNTPTGFEWWFETRRERELDQQLRTLRDALCRFEQGERNESMAHYRGSSGEEIRIQRGLNGCQDLIQAIDAVLESPDAN